MSPLKGKSHAVRRLWDDFEGWAVQQRTSLENEENKWHSTSKPPNADNHSAKVRAARERYISTVREEWAKRLNANKLQDSDWGTMTDQELHRATVVMGGDLDLDEPTKTLQQKAPPPPALRTQSFFSFMSAAPAQPLPSTSASIQPPAPPSAPPPVPVTALVPYLSSHTRAANASSTSSYSFVDPSDFTTDDELYESGASYITVPTDESEGDEPIAIKDPESWGISSNDISSSSNRSSQSTSPDHPFPSPSTGYNFLPHSPPERHTHISPVSPKRSPDVSTKPGKSRLRGPPYVGPVLDDQDETSEEEADFERFKMETRIQKIWEFHHAAAQADVELAMSIYNDRVTKTSSRAGDAAKVAEHEKRMLKLQAAKEEERKSLVSAERKKRREEILRRTNGRDARAPNGADFAGDQTGWNDFFDPHSMHIDFDEHGRVVRREAGLSPLRPVQDDHNELEILQVPPEISPTRASSGSPQDSGTLRGRIPQERIASSGWKKSKPSAASPWQSQSAPLPAATTQVVTFAPNSGPTWAGDDEGIADFPGGFPEDECASTPTASTPAINGWPARKPPVPSKLAQVETALSPADSPPATLPPKTSSPTSPKKPAKKQRLANQKKETAQLSLPTGLTKLDADSPATPTFAPHAPYVNHVQQKFIPTEEEQGPSTPRPSFLASRMKDVVSSISGYMMPESAARPPAPSFDPQPLPNGNSNDHVDSVANGGLSEPGHETPWQRAQRLGSLPTNQNPVVRPAMLDGTAEEAAWARGVRQKTQAHPQHPQRLMPANSAQIKPALFVHPEEEEGSLWERTMKNKMQVSLASMAVQDLQQPLPPRDVMEGKTPWQRMSRQNGQGANASMMNGGSVLPSSAMYSPQMTNSMMMMMEEETPWERMQRLKGNGGVGTGMAAKNGSNVSAPQVQAHVEDEESPWQRMQRLKVQGISAGAGTAPSQVLMEHMNQITAPAPAAEDESPWQRMTRLKAQGIDLTSKPTAAPAAPATKAIGLKSAWGARMEVESVPTNNGDHYWSPIGAAGNGGVKQGVWGQQMQNGTAIPKAKKGGEQGSKRVMIEDVPDEEGANGWKGPEGRLPSDSRVLLDIAEPKPSVPPTMFDNIFQYGEEGEQEEEEYDTSFSSSVPTPSTAPTSPGGDDAVDEAWYMSAMEEMGKGNWDKLIKGGGPPTTPNKSKAPPLLPPLPPQPQPQPITARWGPPLPHVNGSGPRVQPIDGAKLTSALEAVDDKPPAGLAGVRSTPPKAVAEPAAVPAPLVAEKKEPEVKSAPASAPVSGTSKVAAGKGRKARGRK